MKIILHVMCAVLAAAVLSMLGGCTSLQPQSGNKQVTGIMCDKCQSVWFPKVTPGGKPGSGSLVYRMSRRMLCPECESIAATFFRTGRFEHVCPACRGNITRCTAQIVPQRGTAVSSAR